jgi:hypothetical protein
VRAALLLLLAAASSAGPLTDARKLEKRAVRLRQRGGSSATEKAVAAALGWLARTQDESGLWDADGFQGATEEDKGGGWHGERVPCRFDVEVSALATLAFLGAGHTHKGDGPHTKTVARAVARLKGATSGGTLFATAFATQALAEAFDMTEDESLKAAVRRGIEVMTGSRLPDGGWRYYAGNRMASGVPTTTAVVRALHAAERAGFEVDGAYKEPVLTLLDRLVDKKSGRVAYHIDAHKLGYTPTTTNAASALLIRLLLGVPPSDPRIRKGAAVIAKRRPKWSIKFKRVKVKGTLREVQIGYLQHYYWHHGTEALVRIGRESWNSWNGALKKALLHKQRKDGDAAGSWDPAGTYGRVGGRVYSTALCALMLEAYYR